MKEHQLKGRKPHQLTSTLKILIPGQLCTNNCTLKIYNFSHYQREKYSKLLKTDLQYLIKNVLVAFSISAEYLSALMWNANAMKPFRNCSGTTKTCQWLEEANTALYKLHRTFKIKKFLKKKKIYIYSTSLKRCISYHWVVSCFPCWGNSSLPRCVRSLRCWRIPGNSSQPIPAAPFHAMSDPNRGLANLSLTLIWQMSFLLIFTS